MSELETRVAQIRTKLTNVKQVFIVFGERGEYEDHSTWEVCAFDTSAAAEEYAGLLSTFDNEEVLPHSNNSRTPEHAASQEAMRQLDDLFRDYTSSDPDCRPKYHVQCLELSCAVNADEAERLAAIYAASHNPNT